MMNILDKFFRWNVDQNGCWNVTSHFKEPQGYHVVTFRGYRTRAHRLAYMITKGNGEIPKGFIVRHSCDNRSCINPDHLLLGTKQDNMNDMVNRKRSNHWQDRKGKRSKLSHKEVKEIYLSIESSYALEKKYNVTDVQIRRIRNGTRYQSVTMLLGPVPSISFFTRV